MEQNSKKQNRHTSLIKLESLISEMSSGSRTGSKVEAKTLKQRQKEFDQSIMKSQMEKITKAQKRSNIDFANESFTRESLDELLGQVWVREEPKSSTQPALTPTMGRSSEAVDSGAATENGLEQLVPQTGSDDRKDRISAGSYDIGNDFYRHDTSKFMLEPIEIGSPEPVTPSDVAQLRTQLENRIEQKRRLSHMRSVEAENFPSLPVKDEGITGAEGTLQRTTKAHRGSPALRKRAQLDSPTNPLREEAIAEALNESSGETSSLVESTFTIDSKPGATPRKDSERNEQRRPQPDTPVSRHVKFQDEEVILNPPSAAASAAADDDVPPVELASSADPAGDVASGSASNREEEQKIDETASQREEAADDLIGDGLVQDVEEFTKLRQASMVRRDSRLENIMKEVGEHPGEEEVDQEAVSQLKDAIGKRKNKRLNQYQVGNQTMAEIDTSDILGRVFKAAVEYPIDHETEKLKSERKLKELQHFRRKSDDGHGAELQAQDTFFNNNSQVPTGNNNDQKEVKQSILRKSSLKKTNIQQEESKKMNNQQDGNNNQHSGSKSRRRQKMKEDRHLLPEKINVEDFQSNTKGKGAGFEKTLAEAIDAEREEARMDRLLVTDKTARKQSNITLRDEVQYGRQDLNPHLRRAITNIRRKLDSQNADDNGSPRNDDTAEMPINAELARVIEKTYNYIYSVEDKRTLRMVNKVEDLFESAPIMFDDSRVSQQLARLKKIKFDANMLKSHVQIYKEQMAQQKHIRRQLRQIIEKHQIDVDQVTQRSGGEMYISKCNENYNAYHTYKSNEFFQQETSAQRAPREATAMINQIISKVTMQEELFLLGKFILQYLPPKMQRVFLQKNKDILKLDYDDPAIYCKVDENQYLPKPDLNPPPNENFVRSPTGQQSDYDRTPRANDRSPRASPKRKQDSSKSITTGNNQMFPKPAPSSPNKQEQQNQEQRRQSLSRKRMNRLVTMSSSVSGLDRELTAWQQSPLSKISSHATPDLEKKEQNMAVFATQTSTHTRAVAVVSKMVTAYNWQYILQRITNKEHKRRLEDRLEKYLEAQFETMPRTYDIEQGMMERFANLQKLLGLLHDLPNLVTWSKEHIKQTKKARRRKLKEHQMPQVSPLIDHESSIQTNANQFSDRVKMSDADTTPKGNFKRLQLADIQARANQGGGGFSEIAKPKVKFTNGRDELASQDSMYSLPVSTADQVNQIHLDSALTSLASTRRESSQASWEKTAIHKRRGNPAMKKVVAMLVKAKIKRQVPNQVYKDCADIINQALRHDNQASEAHKRRQYEMKQMKLKSRNTRHYATQSQTPNKLSKDLHSDSITQLMGSTEEGSSIHQSSLPVLPAYSKRSETQPQMMNRTPFSRTSRPQGSTTSLNSLGLNDVQKRGNSVLNLSQIQSYASPTNSTFLPILANQNMGKSRIEKSVRNRSHQMLNRMKNMKLMNQAAMGGGDIENPTNESSTRPKFREPIAKQSFSQSRMRNLPHMKQSADLSLKLGLLKQTQDQMRHSSANSSDLAEHSPMMSTANFEMQLLEDKQKLKQIIRMCMNEEYLKANEQENEKKRNKVVFKTGQGLNSDSSKEQFELGDQVGLAFRKSALTALNQDQILYKKMEYYKYIEEIRVEANKEIYDFFEAIDPDTAPKNLKLLYFYFVGSRNLNKEMMEESVQTYREDQMKPQRNDLRKAITGKNRKKN